MFEQEIFNNHPVLEEERFKVVEVLKENCPVPLKEDEKFFMLENSGIIFSEKILLKIKKENLSKTTSI